MSKQPLSKQSLDVAQFKKYPQCINKKQARMVCLNQVCPNYAFFCLQCDDESCEKMHRHENKADKFVAISFKEFVRRVLKEKKPIQELQSAVNTYSKTLERLRTDINEFVQKQLKSLTDIINKAIEVPEDLYPTVKKLREEQYAGMTGKQMDYLWKNCGDTQENLRIQHETANFIQTKEEELKAISEHFQNLNKIDIDKIEETIQNNSQTNTIEHKNQNKRSGSSALSNPSNASGKNSDSKK